jgi:hypothetical protein
MLEQFNFELKYSRVNGHNVTFRYLILLIGLSNNCLACLQTDCFVRSLRVYHRAGQKLELNITRPFLETSMDVVEVWKDDSFEEENAKSIEHHAYYIKNETGQVKDNIACPPPQLFACTATQTVFTTQQKMWYWLSDDKSVIALEKGEEQPMPISFPHLKQRRYGGSGPSCLK